MPFLPPQKGTGNPMTWEKDRHVPDWDTSDPQSQAMERAKKQREHVEDKQPKDGDGKI